MAHTPLGGVHTPGVRVLLVTNGLGYGGAERLVEALAVDLKAAGDSVRVIAVTRGGPIADTLRAQGIRVSVLGLSSSMDLRIPLKLRQASLRFHAQIIHSHLAVSDIAQASAGLLQRSAQHVITVHNPGVELSPTKRALWRPALAQADHVLAVSQAVAQSLPLPSEVMRPSLVEPLPIDPQARSIGRRRLGVPEDGRPVVLAVGRLARVKGFDILKAAAESWTGPAAHWVLVGDGPKANALRGGRLKLLGARDDVPQLLPGADVVVLPSRSEGLPQIVLQAMAAERPVLATSVGGTPELVHHRHSGWLIPPESPEALIEALAQLLEDEALRIRLGRAARVRLETEGWTRQATLRRTRTLYQSLWSRR